MNISDDDVIFKILQKLPPRFHESVSFIRLSKDLSSTEVAYILRADEWKQRLKSYEEASGSEKWCDFCRKNNHKTSECYSKNKKGR
ncbi:unnamed protein product [Arabis nemorensis]|uniref:Uncharacterized protein n=1 Tax=Arabis nemorensis TaxID=586526 RepID=A0A565CRM2_9BRAS|nr:unnamed protein product [Arabis nemorensis]